MPDLRERLTGPGILLMDGATGSQLQKLGLPPGHAPDLWNLEEPERVKQHYRSYIEAGSEAFLTNSFGASRPRLEMEGSGHLVHEVNRAAAQLAREVAGDGILVLGSMGPTGVLMEPMGKLTYDKAVQYFAEQAAGLAEGGVDSLHIETMSDLNEAKAAIEGAHRAADLPVTVTMSFDTHGRTMMGITPVMAVRELWSQEVLAVGANCGNSLDDNLKVIMLMRTEIPDAVLVAKPNAGLPRMEDGQTVYDLSPETMGEYARKFAAQHIKMFGGCCGNTPDHIRAIAAALKDFTPPPLAEVLAQNRAALEQTEESPTGRRRSRKRR